MKYFVNDMIFEQLKMTAYHKDFTCNFAIVHDNPTQTKIINTPKLFFCQKKDNFFGKKIISRTSKKMSTASISQKYLSTFMNFNSLLTNIIEQNLTSINIENQEFLIDYNQDENIFITKNMIFSINSTTISVSFLFDDYSIEIHNHQNWIHIRKVFLLKESSFSPEIAKNLANH